MFRTFDRWTISWLLSCVAFAIHILDESMRGSFGFYSDVERMMTNVMPSMHMTPFNFDVWLINMTGTLAVLFLLTPLVRSRNPLMIPASFVFAAFLTGNAALHLVMAVSQQRLVTGSETAPLMLAAGLFLFLSTARGLVERDKKGA
ncbi:MAG: hypothetical protein ABL973_08605 [Micropepsaceae bacterium]